MRVILVEDVERLGKVGDIREVADGYGRNYLIPKGIAEFASPEGLKRAEENQRAAARRQEAVAAEMVALAETLEGLVVRLKAKSGEQGRLYGSVTTADIADEAQRICGQGVDKRKVALDEPIHQLGEYEVPVKLTADLAPKMKVIVEAEAVEEKPEPKPEAKTGRKRKAKTEPKADVSAEADKDWPSQDVTEPDVEGPAEAESEAEAEGSSEGESSGAE